MYQAQKVRQGFVKIHRCPNGKFRFSGLNVIGRDRDGRVANRLVWMHHKAPDWFRDLCNDYADTTFQVEVQVDKLHGPSVALVIPMAKCREEALYAYKQRYGRIPEATVPCVDAITPTAFANAFKAHEYFVSQQQLTIIAHFEDGLKSYTRVKHKHTGRVYRIIGGMLVNKVVSSFQPEDHKWQQAVKSFIRIKEEE